MLIAVYDFAIVSHFVLKTLVLDDGVIAVLLCHARH